MPVTVNIYEESAVRYLGTYGAVHQSISTAWSVKQATMRLILCSTDVAQFNSSFAGTVEQLLSSGVQEIPTGYGYFQQGFALKQFQAASFFLVFGNGYKFNPVNEGGISGWAAIGGSISAKSALLFMELPNSSASTLYGRSYPLAMIDFDGTRTATAGNNLIIEAPTNGGLFNWTR